MFRSVNTVNADAARKLFGTEGHGIVWAVAASGIDGSHPHFAKYKNLELPQGLYHKDFTAVDNDTGSPLMDEFGLGTFVAGIVAGELSIDNSEANTEIRDYTETGERQTKIIPVHSIAGAAPIAGMAPQCKLLSLKILDNRGYGQASRLIESLTAIQEMNDYGNRTRVHGVVLPLGYDYDPERYACGLSPICVEVERLVRSGVVVVVAAGNTGYGYVQTLSKGMAATAGLDNSINDPGNAELAITVGATHRDLPLVYGVSYFSSKGPTIDGRNKPDLVAPGEKIISCYSSNRNQKESTIEKILYREESGTSMAAAHVAGVIAAYLSVHKELIGRPELVKQIFLNTATDLNRKREYQGLGLINLMAALQQGIAAVPNAKVSTKQPVETVVPTLVKPNGSSKTTKQPLRLMFSYSHKDEQLLDELKIHLVPLERQDVISLWHDRNILAGDEWKTQIARELEEADIIVLLISAYFLASDYCYDIEMERALERHNAGKVRVIPVLVSHADWRSSPFAKLNPLPRGEKPVTRWEDQHEAWNKVAEGIREAAQKMLEEK